MNRIIVIPALAAIAICAYVDDARAHDSCKKLECQKTKQKIAKIESKMRRGYSVSAGEKMQQQLRELRRKRSSVCR